MKKSFLIISLFMTSVAFAQTHEVTYELYDNGYPKSIKTYKEIKGKLELVKETKCYEDGRKNNQDFYKNGQKNGQWTKWYANGQKYLEGYYKMGEKRGFWTEWAENGQKKKKTNYKDGNLVDEWIFVYEYYKNGKQKIEGTLKNKKEDGLWTYWHENGQKQKEGKYNKGKEDGLWTSWHKNGQKQSEKIYSDGKGQGLWIYWDKNGQKKKEISYKDGNLVDEWTFVLEYYENGEKKVEGTLKNKKEDGLWIYWYANGQKKKEGKYNEGKEDGLWTSWHENGQKQSVQKYSDGKDDGLWIYWDKNGQKREEETYKWIERKGDKIWWDKNGQKWKQETYNWSREKVSEHWWHENGQPRLEKNYKDGKWHGFERQWDKNGQLKHEIRYEVGERNGLCRWWYDNGQLRLGKNYKNGKLDGLYDEWYENGIQKEERIYKDEVLVYYIRWTEDGRAIVPIIPDFVTVRGGTFEMGQPDPNIGSILKEEKNGWTADEQPVHTVTLSDFNISTTEVTFEQYDAFCDATDRKKPDDEGWGRGDRPVIYVTRRDAIAFCEWLSEEIDETIRLPSEAEWEYAARGGNESRNYTYSGGNNLDGVGWCRGNSNNMTNPVGKKQPNELGLYDMSGNVSEWCSDWYHPDYYSSSPKNNPQGPKSGENGALRGGSWSLSDEGCRVASRFEGIPDYWGSDNGFRCVKSVK